MDVFAIVGGIVAALLGLILGWFSYSRSQQHAAKQVATVHQLIDRVGSRLPVSTVIPGTPDGVRARGVAPGKAEDQLQELLNNVVGRTKVRFELQGDHYADALRQSSLYFTCSLVTSFSGFALLLFGAGVGLAGKADIGLVTAIGGIVAEAAAALVFVQANRAKSDAQQNLTFLVTATEADEKRLMAYLYAAQIDNENARDAAYAELARALTVTAATAT